MATTLTVMAVWTEEALTSHGVSLSDEGLHPVAPGDAAWNESLFFDWIDASGQVAGHCRIGRHPGLGHLWVWVYLYDGARWVRLDAPTLNLADMAEDGWGYEGDALSLHWEVHAPLQSSTLSLRGLGADPSGEPVAFDLQLRFDAAGPAHGMAARKVKGKDGESYLAGRYEQPYDVTGHMTLGEVRHTVSGHGERDHSWGPRHWAMQWLFLVLEGAEIRAQCTEVLIGGAMRICVGYVQHEAMHTVSDVAFDLSFADASEVEAPCEGRVSVTHEGGTLSGHVTPLTGVALDDGHCLPEGVASLYRRTLIRFTPDDGSPSVMGWLETHRLVTP